MVSKLPEKKRKNVSSDNQPWTKKNTWGEEDVHIFAWDLRDNIRSVMWDWRWRSSGRSNDGERSAGLSSEGREPLVTQADLSAPRVCSPAVALFDNKGPCHRRKICANSLSLWLYFYYTQSSPSKNKNINCIFIYLRIFRCLSCASIYYKSTFFQNLKQLSSL